MCVRVFVCKCVYACKCNYEHAFGNLYVTKLDKFAGIQRRMHKDRKRTTGAFDPSYGRQADVFLFVCVC